jgi:hypothetical protein
VLPWARFACCMFPRLDSLPTSWRRVFHHRCFWIFGPVSTSALLPLWLRGSVRDMSHYVTWLPEICHIMWHNSLIL